jgi:predicted membrane protein
MGPEFTAISSLLMTICETLVVFSSFEGDEYWTALNVALGVMLIWSVICVIDLIGLEPRMCGCYRYWTKLLMPTLSNFLFLPLVSLLSTVFMCSKGISESLTESFFNKDCHEFCWRGKHIGYAIAVL